MLNSIILPSFTNSSPRTKNDENAHRSFISLPNPTTKRGRAGRDLSPLVNLNHRFNILYEYRNDPLPTILEESEDSSYHADGAWLSTPTSKDDEEEMSVLDAFHPSRVERIHVDLHVDVPAQSVGYFHIKRTWSFLTTELSMMPFKARRALVTT